MPCSDTKYRITRSVASLKLPRHVLRPEMGVAEKLAVIPMPAYQGDLSNAQALFEEAADRFVAKVVEVQVIDPRSGDQPLPCQSQGIGRGGKHPLAVPRNPLKWLGGPPRQRDARLSRICNSLQSKKLVLQFQILCINVGMLLGTNFWEA